MGERRRNIFSDKASLVLRTMFAQPEKKWVIRDFTEKLPLSIGFVAEIISEMDQGGYIERVKKGSLSYSVLTNKKRLIRDWNNYYSIGSNKIELYYNENLHLSQIKDFFSHKNLESSYALTLHSGGNLMTSLVSTNNAYFYLKGSLSEKQRLELKQQLNLKQLVKGGNIFIINPYYKKSIFETVREIDGYTVVSDLQLYLDLFHFNPRGREHAEFLENHLFNQGD